MTLFKFISPIVFFFSFGSFLYGSILEMYRGSVHERLLDQQIKNYRAYAAKNAQTFGKEFKHLPNFDRHVGLEKLRKVIPASQNHEIIPEYRFKAGLKAPGPTLNTFFIKPPRR